MENKIKVLICDDTISGVRMAAELKQFGISAFTRRNDKETILRSILKEKPNVVVSDLNLYDDDAVSVMRTARTILPLSPAFVIFSDIYNNFIEKQVTESGVSCFLFSPFDSKELYSAIISALNKKKYEQYDLEVVVTDVIQKIGMPANIRGYRYIRTAVMECIENANCLNSITKSLYPIVAEKHETTTSRVERAIRHAISATWQKGNKNAIHSFFGYDLSTFNQPTNSEFIFLMTDKVRLLMKSGNPFSFMT